MKLAAVLLAVALAGCIGGAPGGDEWFTPHGETVERFDGAFTWSSPRAHDGNGTWLDIAFDAGPHAVQQMVPLAGAEPNIGVTSTGSLFVSTFDQVQRSQDFGQSWEQVINFTTLTYPNTDDMFSTSDPMLWVDPDTDRIFSNHMHPALLCTYSAWSDDDGEPSSWIHRPASCGSPYLDHQKLMTAAPGPDGVLPPGALAVYPNVVYLCVNKPLFRPAYGTWCAVSFDGGLNYAYDNQIATRSGRCSQINGHPAAFPDGTVVVPLGAFAAGINCPDDASVVLSSDNGMTWQQRFCTPDLRQAEVDPDITITPDGTAYMLMRSVDDQLAYLVRSTDKFATCDVFRVSPPDHTLAVFAGITSGADGRIAMSYLGTRDPQGRATTPSNATGGTHWHAFVTTSFDANSENPTFVTQQVTPAEDPVQVGCVWLSGGFGGPHRCRNLLDFIDMTSDQEGRFYVAITDGCVPRNGCSGDPDSSMFQSRDRQIAVLVQSSGLGLWDPSVPLDDLNLSHPESLQE